MYGFKFHLSLSQNWSSGLRVSFTFFLSGSTVKKFFFFLFFYREGHGLAEKLLLIIFIFLTNSIDISLYADSLCRSPFFILKKVSAPITSGKCSRGHYMESLFCIYDKLEEISFIHITYISLHVETLYVWEQKFCYVIIRACLYGLNVEMENIAWCFWNNYVMWSNIFKVKVTYFNILNV